MERNQYDKKQQKKLISHIYLLADVSGTIIITNNLF